MMNALTRTRGDRWLYAFCLDAEEWHGCTDTLEGCVIEALCDASSFGLETLFVALGRKMTKAECEEHGETWPWYEVNPREALRIVFPAQEVGR